MAILTFTLYYIFNIMLLLLILSLTNFSYIFYNIGSESIISIWELIIQLKLYIINPSINLIIQWVKYNYELSYYPYLFNNFTLCIMVLFKYLSLSVVVGIDPKITTPVLNIIINVIMGILTLLYSILLLLIKSIIFLISPLIYYISPNKTILIFEIIKFMGFIVDASLRYIFKQFLLRDLEIIYICIFIIYTAFLPLLLHSLIIIIINYIGPHLGCGAIFRNYRLKISVSKILYFKVINPLLTYTGYDKFLSIFSNYSNSNFAYYLTGVTEGNGYIYVPEPHHKKENGEISISFHSCNLPLIQLFLEILGGSYRIKPNTNTLEYFISSKLSVLFVIYLLNGKLRTPKLIVFNNLITWFNESYYLDIPLFEYDKSHILDNAWLSGFIDTDASFDVKFTISKVNGFPVKLQHRFRISQRQFESQTGESYGPIMELIQTTFTGYLRKFSTERTIGKYNFIEHGYQLETTSLYGIDLVTNYLDRHPIFSYKALNFYDWRESIDIRNNRLYKTPEGRDRLIQLRKGMNKGRTYFNWDHLEKLFTLLP